MWDDEMMAELRKAIKHADEAMEIARTAQAQTSRMITYTNISLWLTFTLAVISGFAALWSIVGE